MARVSIGLPVRNGEAYLERALESILDQTYTDFEVLISDNASTDATPEISQKYSHLDSRIRYVWQEENIGASANFNYVFHNTSGEYFRWASHDDMIAPEYLAACVDRLDADDGTAALAYSQTMIIDKDDNELRLYDSVTRKRDETASIRLAEMIGPGDATKSMLYWCYPVFGLMRRKTLEGTSLIANFPRSDTLLLVELALRGRFLEIERPLFLRREHEDSSVILAERTASRRHEVERLLAAWYDPRKGNVHPRTMSRLGLGYIRAVMRTPLPMDEKMACFCIVSGWVVRRSLIIGREQVLAARDYLAAG